jgi:hypothetical protein
MSDNQGNPLQGSETDLQKATKAVDGLLNPKEEEVIGQQEPPKEEIKQNSPEPQQEESEEEQPLEQEIKEEETEADSKDEAEDETSEDVSQDEEQIETQEKQDSTYKVKVAGQEFEVTLDELRNGYSRDADYRRKTEELSNERKSFQSQSEKQRQDYSQKLNEMNQLLSNAQQELNSEISSSDLEALYDEDPAQAAKIEHKLRRKQEKLASALQKTQSEQKAQFDGYLQMERTKLVNKIPDFADPGKALNLKNNMRSHLAKYGFNDSEIAQVYDHRILMLVNDAMKFGNLQKAKPNIAKKISKPSRTFSSGIKQDKNDVRSKASREKFSRLKKSGSMKAAQDVFLDMINNNK